jgi:hypothetical protein
MSIDPERNQPQTRREWTKEDRVAKIVVNNISYNSIEEMPPDVRKAYEQALGVLGDKNQNGIPDILEGAMRSGTVNISTGSTVDTRFVVDGAVYSNVDALPPEARQKYDQAMAKAAQVMGDANHNGVPDILEGILPAGPASGPQTDPSPAMNNNNLVPGATPPIIGAPSRNSGLGWLLIANIAVLMMLIAIIAFGLLVLLPRLR